MFYETTCNHYVIVVGIVKDKIIDKKWLKISSWGKELYVDYEEYINYIDSGVSRNVTSNILYIGE